MSAEQLITKHLDIWTSAHKTRSSAGRGSSNKLDLYGIKKLRELILELAVRGKLVPQDPNDEPASELVRKISEEKKQLVKDGRAKKEKSLNEISQSEIPFNIPAGWKWVRLGSISETTTGYAFKSTQYVEKGTFVLRVTNINPDGSIDKSDAKFIDEEVSKSDYSKFALSEDDVLLVMVGGTLGKVGVVTKDVLPAVLNQNMWKLIRFGNLTRDFFIYGINFINRSQLDITNSTHGHLAQGEYLEKLFPLAPVAEQQRIVAKVNELMAFCDELEQAQTDNIAAHAQLVEALLTTLTNSKDHQELQVNWQRIAEHFDTLFTTEDSIDQLKQTILQLAVMGKLVPQDPNDEPASELLKKIAAEKAQLIKEGKVKKEKPIPAITDEEKPYALPNGWSFVRLIQITSIRGGSTPSMAKAEFWNGDVLWVSPKDMHDGTIYSSELKITEKALKETSLELVPIGSILIVGRSGILKRKLPAQITGVPCTVNQDIKAITPISPLLDKYLQLMFWGNEREILTRDVKQGTTVQSLVYESLFHRPFSLPPLNEQHRIVAKVDELVTLCDTIKQGLQNAQKTQHSLVDTLIENSFC